MRKHLKKKRRSCALCKPHKMAKACRWKVKELDQLQRHERECVALSGTRLTPL